MGNQCTCFNSPNNQPTQNLSQLQNPLNLNKNMRIDNENNNKENDFNKQNENNFIFEDEKTFSKIDEMNLKKNNNRYQNENENNRNDNNNDNFDNNDNFNNNDNYNNNYNNYDRLSSCYILLPKNYFNYITKNFSELSKTIKKKAYDVKELIYN